MARPRDTSAVALERQRAEIRLMTPAERLETAIRLSDEVRALAEAGVRRRDPLLSDAGVQSEVSAIVQRASRRSAGPSRD